MKNFIHNIKYGFAWGTAVFGFLLAILSLSSLTVYGFILFARLLGYAI